MISFDPRQQIRKMAANRPAVSEQEREAMPIHSFVQLASPASQA
jgi:hypothetical protein